jgi:hypothetical protein
MSLDLLFNPELRLVDGTVIRDREDAVRFARAQKPQPGVDERDEVLRRLKRASRPEEVESAAQHFRRWLAGLKLLDEPS